MKPWVEKLFLPRSSPGTGPHRVPRAAPANAPSPKSSAPAANTACARLGVPRHHPASSSSVFGLNSNTRKRLALRRVSSRRSSYSLRSHNQHLQKSHSYPHLGLSYASTTAGSSPVQADQSPAQAPGRRLLTTCKAGSRISPAHPSSCAASQRLTIIRTNKVRPRVL